jgi:hypothetical protein
MREGFSSNSGSKSTAFDSHQPLFEPPALSLPLSGTPEPTGGARKLSSPPLINGPVSHEISESACCRLDETEIIVFGAWLSMHLLARGGRIMTELPQSVRYGGGSSRYANLDHPVPAQSLVRLNEP